MRRAITVGFSFGVTSGIITTLGLMIGLNSGTHSRLAVIGGVLTIAIADAFSDALGIHISEESENQHTTKQIWVATIATFITKFVFASLFILPILFLELSLAVKVSVVWGLLMLSFLSYKISKTQGIKPWKVIGEHLLIAILVMVITHNIGNFVASKFGC